MAFGNVNSYGGNPTSFQELTGTSGLRRRALAGMPTTPQQNYLGVSGALNPPPQVQNFYQALLGQQLRGIGQESQMARTNALENLDARGLGQSSLVGRTLGGIARGQQAAAQTATTNVQGLQFQQLLSALDFERQMQLLRLQHKLSGSNPYLAALNSLGSAAAFIFPQVVPSGDAGTAVSGVAGSNYREA